MRFDASTVSAVGSHASIRRPQNGCAEVIYDDSQAIVVTSDGDRLSLRERSLPATVARWVFGLCLLSVGSLVAIAFLGPGEPRPAGHGLSAWLGWGVIGLFLTALSVLPGGGGNWYHRAVARRT
jgi:hypothetical protein